MLFRSVSQSRYDGIDALDLKVWTSPYVVDGENYTVFAVQDISNEKRRDVLERIFFHDIINTAGGLKGLAEILQRKHISTPSFY